MFAYWKPLAFALVLVLVAGHLATSATFVTNRASLRPGESISSRSPKNGNRTRFIFAEIVQPGETKARSAFLQWAPLMPRARDYKNGSLVQQGETQRLWINGIWYTVSFDGEALFIR